MRSRIPKVLHPLAGRTLLGHVLHTAAELEPQRTALVVRHARDEVVAHARDLLDDIVIADQDDVPGTGRAVQCGLVALDAAAADERARTGTGDALRGAVVVTAGDVPLLDAATLRQLLAAHITGGNAVTVLTTHLPDPQGYGRVLRGPDGGVTGVVEERDATPEQRAITEINSSVYVFDAEVLRDGLGRVSADNEQGEVYLTDVVGLAHRDGRRVQGVVVADEWLVTGINDRAQLAELGAELNRRIVTAWMRAGVSVLDPATTWLDVDVELAPDVTLLPGTHLAGTTRVAPGASIGPETTLTDVEVGPDARVVRTHGSASLIGAGADVGPFTYLRPGTVLGAEGKIGSFVETKNATIGDRSKVPHLSYVGDAEVGHDTNIGAATIFVNFDGVAKNRTTVGSHARTGSANMFVAPVSIGDGAYTGAGTVVRRDVPPGALGINVAPQRNVDDWVLRRRGGTAAAQAAAAALGADGEPQTRAEQARTEQETVQQDGAGTDTGGGDSQR